MRVVALLATYNEERFIRVVIEHLRDQGVCVYVIDNGSTDRTIEIAERYFGSGVVGIESWAGDGVLELRRQLRRKEQLADAIDADWVMHVDADEIHVAPTPGRSLAQAFAEAEEAGFNAVNFLEFTFVPTREAPDHEHPGFQRSMRSYYPFLPDFPHRLNAWKRQDGPIELAWSGGHRVRFPGIRMAPESLYMRHYLYLSVLHGISKFVERRFLPEERAAGWFGWRGRLTPDLIELPSAGELRTYVADHLLDPSRPRRRHRLEELYLRALETHA